MVLREKKKAAQRRPCVPFSPYKVLSISKPHASSKGSGMYLLFLLRRAHSRRRVERMYWSGVNLNSLTACSKDVTTGITGPMGSGFPQLGFPRLLAMSVMPCLLGYEECYRYYTLGFGFLMAAFGFNLELKFTEKRAFSSLKGK